MGRSSYSDLSITRSDSCAKKGRIKECPWILSSGTSERSLANQHFPSLPEREEGEGERERDRERRIDNCVMPHYFEAMPAPCTISEIGVSPGYGKMVARLHCGAVVGNRSCDRSVALSRMYFHLRFKLHSRQAASGEHGGVELGFGVHHDSNTYSNVTT
jgi:hypothetical protein